MLKVFIVVWTCFCGTVTVIALLWAVKCDDMWDLVSKENAYLRAGVKQLQMDKSRREKWIDLYCIKAIAEEVDKQQISGVR